MVARVLGDSHPAFETHPYYLYATISHESKSIPWDHRPLLIMHGNKRLVRRGFGTSSSDTGSPKTTEGEEALRISPRSWSRSGTAQHRANTKMKEKKDGFRFGRPGSGRRRIWPNHLIRWLWRWTQSSYFLVHHPFSSLGSVSYELILMVCLRHWWLQILGLRVS